MARASVLDRTRWQRNWRSGRIALVMFAAAGSLGSVWFNHLVSSRLAARPRSDLRALGAGLSAMGFLALGLQLAIVGWFGRSGHGRTRLTRRFVVRYSMSTAMAGVVAGAVAAMLVRADTSYRLAIAAHVAASTTAVLVAVVPRAEILDAERWWRLGFLMAFDPAVRLTVGWLTWSDDRGGSSLLALTCAQVATAAMAFALRPERTERVAGADAPQPTVRLLGVGALASAGLLVTALASTVALRWKLGADAAVFNEAAVTSRAVVFLPLVFSVMFFPAMSRNPTGSRELRRAYLSALVWTAVATSGACLAIVVQPRAITDLLVADSSTAPVSIIRTLALSALILALATVSILLYIAHGSRLSLAAWPAASIVVLGQLLARSASQLVIAGLIGAVALLVAVSVPALLRIQPVLQAERVRHWTHGTVPHVDLTVVVPSYNPGAAVIETVTSLHTALGVMGVRGTIIVVSDGSTDGSDLLLDELQLPGVVHVRHEVNRGKGAALRTGFARANSSFVGFIDADGDLPPDVFGEMLEVQAERDADIVFGSKLHPDSIIEASALRRAYSLGYRLLIRLLFRIDVRDTQTGVKLYRGALIHAVLPVLCEEEFALDLELFIAARAAGYESFAEVPVELRRVQGSTITVAAIRRLVTDTLRLFWRAKITLQYDRTVYHTTTPDGSSTGPATAVS